VGINNTITLYYEEDDETEVCKIVTSIRGDSLGGRISIESPIGKAVLGHKAGDRVYVKVNETNGFYVVIKKIENTTDTKEDTIRTY
jgi:transcription elongation factor GreA